MTLLFIVLDVLNDEIYVIKGKQLKKIIHLNFDRILFDNMSINNLRKAVQITNNRFETEASGGVNLKNVKKIAQTKVDRICHLQLLVHLVMF